MFIYIYIYIYIRWNKDSFLSSLIISLKNLIENLAVAKFLFPFVLFVLSENKVFFFLSGFSFTDTDASRESRKLWGPSFCSSLPLRPAHKHSDIYLQNCMWDDFKKYFININGIFSSNKSVVNWNSYCKNIL